MVKSMVKICFEILGILLFLNVINSRGIPPNTLDKLESLINDYKTLTSAKLVNKESKTSANKDATSDVDYESYTLMKCAKAVRVAYHECFQEASTKKDKTKCAMLFYTTYTRCFYTNKPRKDFCINTCIRECDKCIIGSSKVEEFVCMTGRSSCLGGCPTLVQTQSDVHAKKESRCNQDCDSDYLLCNQQSAGMEESFICSAGRSTCQSLC